MKGADTDRRDNAAPVEIGELDMVFVVDQDMGNASGLQLGQKLIELGKGAAIKTDLRARTQPGISLGMSPDFAVLMG